jgi:hypothetical protein
MADKQNPSSFAWRPENEDSHVADHGVTFGVAIGVSLIRAVSSAKIAARTMARAAGTRSAWST